MADVMVTVMPFAGHVAPVLRAAEALLAAGHQVRAYTGSAYTGRFERAGAAAVPWQVAADFDERDPASTFPRVGRPGARGVLANIEDVFVGTAVGQVADLTAEYRRRPWDLLLGDSLALGGSLAAEAVRTPWASLSVVPLTLPSRDLPPPGLPVRPGHGPLVHLRDAALHAAVSAGTTPLRRAYRRSRAAVGLPAGRRRLQEGWFSPFLVLALGVPGLEAPRSDLPRHVHFIGAFPSPPAPQPLPPWWAEATSSGRRVVHVTQGTFNTDARLLIGPALEALAGQDLSVLVSTGVPGRTTLRFPVPANAYVTDLLPYADLLPRTDVMVTNGGWGGVLAALSHGVPLVVAGADLDKPTIAAMVARSGAGLDLRTGHPRPATIAAAVDRILAEPGFQGEASRLATELAAHDTAGGLVALTEQLLATGRPVLRTCDPWAPDACGGTRPTSYRAGMRA